METCSLENWIWGIPQGAKAPVSPRAVIEWSVMLFSGWVWTLIVWEQGLACCDGHFATQGCSELGV